jgi:predicted DNA-binding transcriptional regulator YafY
MAKAIHHRPSRRRAARLYRLLELLDKQARPRSQLLRRLRVGMRTYYRDLNLLRTWGIETHFEHGKYQLADSLAECLKRLPIPDPQLSFAEARSLAATRTSGGRKLKKLLKDLTE